MNDYDNTTDVPVSEKFLSQLNISVTYCLPLFEGAYDIMLTEMDEEPDFDTWDEENKQRLAMSVGERLFEDQFDIDLTFGSQVTCRKNGHTYYVTVVY